MESFRTIRVNMEGSSKAALNLTAELPYVLTRCENQLVPQGEGDQAVRVLQDVSV